MVRIVAIGDNDADCYLSDGRMYPGGNCFNVAVHARRLGAETAFVGAVADDPAGRLIRGALEAEGVDTRHLRRVPGLTAYCVIGHENGDRVFLSNDLGVSRFAPSDADLDLAATFDAAHVGQSSGLDAWLPAIAARTRLSYDFSTRRDDDHRRRIAPLCWLASISAGDMTGEAARRPGLSLRAAGAGRVLVTPGARGAILVDAAGEVHRDRGRRIVPVDTLGAGDTLIAGVLAGLLAGDAPAQVLARATDAAARTCGHPGAVGHGAPIALPVDLPELSALRGAGSDA